MGRYSNENIISTKKNTHTMLTTWLISLTPIIILCFGIFAVLTDKNNKVNLFFLFLSISLSGWLICGLIMQYQLGHGINPLLTSRISMGFASFIAASFLSFSLNFTSSRHRHKNSIIKLIYALAAVSTLLSLHGSFMRNIQVIDHAAVREFGKLSILFTLFVMGCVVVSTIILVHSFRNHPSPIYKLRIKYILTGISSSLIISICFSLILPLLGLNKLFFIGHLSTIVLMACISYAVIKQQIMTFDVLFARLGIFTVVYASLFALPFWVGFTKHIWDVALVLVLVLATSGHLIYRYLNNRAENILLFQQKRYHKYLTDTVEALSEEYDLNLILNTLAITIRGAVGISFVSVFLYDKNNGVFNLHESSSISSMPKNMVIYSSSPIAAKSMISNKPFLVDELHIDAQLSENLTFRISMIIPLNISNEALGFIMLGDKLNGGIYINEDITVFKRLAHQISLAVKHSLLVDDLKQSQEKLFRSEKLASIGGLAEGVAHQMNNRLTHFSMGLGEISLLIEDYNAKNKEQLEKDSILKAILEQTKENADSMLNNVRRTRSIISGILNFTNANNKEEIAFSKFMFEEILETASELVKLKHDIRELPVEKLITGSSVIFSEKSLFTECLYNILDNNYEAIKEKMDYHTGSTDSFTPLIMVKLIQDEANNKVRIEISDNGIGIKDADKLKVFAPYFTTKSSSISGSGIGMYIVKRILEEKLGGKIWIESCYKQGTTIFVELPKTKPA